MSPPGVEVRCEPVLGDVHGVGAVHDQRLHHRDQHVLHQGGQQPGGTTHNTKVKIFLLNIHLFLFQFWIMSTYQLAQTLIMLSSMSH